MVADHSAELLGETRDRTRICRLVTSTPNHSERFPHDTDVESFCWEDPSFVVVGDAIVVVGVVGVGFVDVVAVCVGACCGTTDVEDAGRLTGDSSSSSSSTVDFDDPELPLPDDPDDPELPDPEVPEPELPLPDEPEIPEPEPELPEPDDPEVPEFCELIFVVTAPPDDPDPDDPDPDVPELPDPEDPDPEVPEPEPDELDDPDEPEDPEEPEPEDPEEPEPDPPEATAGAVDRARATVRSAARTDRLLFAPTPPTPSTPLTPPTAPEPTRLIGLLRDGVRTNAPPGCGSPRQWNGRST